MPSKYDEQTKVKAVPVGDRLQRTGIQRKEILRMLIRFLLASGVWRS
jgi:hypothetical protein